MRDADLHSSRDLRGWAVGVYRGREGGTGVSLLHFAYLQAVEMGGLTLY